VADTTGAPDPRFNPKVPNIARIYDYWLGGKDNFEADRKVGDMILQSDPGVAFSVRANRAFHTRAVRYLVAEAGVRQFLDIGTGIPAAENTHEVAQAIAPESRIVYVDNDPIVLSHAKALLNSTPEGACAYLDADLRDPATIVAEAAKTLDFSQPVAVMLIAILHWLPDEADPRRIVSELMDAVPAGSYLALSHMAKDVNAEVRAETIGRTGQFMKPPTTRERAEISRYFDGLELVDPGIVLVSEWRPHSELESRSPAYLWSGVARKA
jgi:hypothetical protein